MTAAYKRSTLFGSPPNSFPKLTGVSLNPIGSEKEAAYLAYLDDIFSSYRPEIRNQEEEKFLKEGLEAFPWLQRTKLPRSTWTSKVRTSPPWIQPWNFNSSEESVNIPQAVQKQFITAADNEGEFPVFLGELLAQQCDLVYEDLNSAKFSLAANPFFSNEAVFSNADAEGLGFMFENHAFLVFRGSSSFLDWYRNFKFTKQEDGDVRVHKGFFINLNLLQEQLDIWLDEIPKECNGFICSGHSLGGAMATLCAYRLAVRGYKVSHVITFGAPRVGDLNFRNAYKDLKLQKKTFRVKNGEDIVSSIPPEILGYSHVGQLFVLPKKRVLSGTPIAGHKSEWWSIMTLFFIQIWQFYYFLKALPAFFGFFHSSFEHQRLQGYSSTLGLYIDAITNDHVLNKGKIDKLRRLHRMYYSGNVK